jgi:uncharacterized protein (DUF58 family)
LNTRELLKKVRKVEIKTKGLSKQIFSGEYHSAFKGRGMSFSEVRNYQYGDDVRNIDWNVTARTGEPFVKVFEEERELTLMLLVDLSPSAFFGTRSMFKNNLITELCAVLAFSAAQNNDKVGIILFTDQVELYMPPKKGKSHILRIIRELINFEVTGKTTNLSAPLIYLNNIIKKRAIVFVLSDFLTKGYSEALRIAAKKHDIIGLHIYDETEKTLPRAGLIDVEDAETGMSKLIDTSDKRIREAYMQRFDDHEKYFNQSFQKAKSDVLSIQTDQSYIPALHQFFKRRMK